MSKKKITALVPRLRFPCFSDKWKKESLSVYLKESKIKGSTGKFAKKLTVKLWGKGVFEKQESLSGSENTQYYSRRKGQFIYSKLAFSNQSFGIIPEHLDGYESTVDLPCFDVKQKLNINFLLEYVQRPTFYKNYGEIADGSSSKRIKVNTFLGFPIYLPTLPEQQKIVDCLSSLDDLISAEDKKLLALKDHKKGLMQKLFPAEGKTIPEWRFPEFRDSGKWEVKTLDSFFKIGSSKRVLQENWTDKGVPFYRTRELVSLSKEQPFGSKIFISEQLYSKLANTYGFPTEGDFLVSGVGTLGICYQVKKEDKFYFKDGNVLWFKLNQGLLSSFFKYCFQSDYIQNQILNQTSKSTVGTYTIQNAKRTKMLYTENILEQQKISGCLSYVDNLISLQVKKIQALKTHKKALIQGLFPSVEEVPQ